MKYGADAADVLKGGTDVLKFNNWDDMKNAYKGTITQFVKENKPKYSPDIKNGLIMAVQLKYKILTVSKFGHILLQQVIQFHI